MSNTSNKTNVTVYSKVKDLPREILWQEVVNQFAVMLEDLDRPDIVRAIRKDSSSCIFPDVGAIMWEGLIHSEAPSVDIRVYGPIVGHEQRLWSCSIVFSGRWELTPTSSAAMMTVAARLLALRWFVEGLNDRNGEIEHTPQSPSDDGWTTPRWSPGPIGAA